MTCLVTETGYRIGYKEDIDVYFNIIFYMAYILTHIEA